MLENYRKEVEYGPEQIKIWQLMLKSKASAEPAPTVWAGLCRVNKLTSDYVHEMYGSAALEHKGRFYTPDCTIIPEPKKTTEEKRAEIRGDVKSWYTPDAETVKAEAEFEAMKIRKGYTGEQWAEKVEAWKLRNPEKAAELAPSEYMLSLLRS